METPRVVGSSVILRYQDDFVFELQKPHKWTRDDSGQVWIGLGCIGGSIERGEDPLQALQREALEEIGTTVDIIPSANPIFLNSDGTLGEPVHSPLNEGAFLQWHGDQPECSPNMIASYLGKTETPPVPADIPAVILAHPKKLRIALARSPSLAQIEQLGMKIVSREGLPGDARLAPKGTAKRLFDLMEKAGAQFGESLPHDWLHFFIEQK